MNASPPSLPQILAPAGNKAAFLAALAAGADAVYCGLKQLSARMEAKNFTLDELAGLTELAHKKNTHVYITLNTLLKPDEIQEAGKLLDSLRRFVHPDALIIQDLAWVDLAAQTGFQGELHLSTLANVSFGAALPLMSRIPKIRRWCCPGNSALTKSGRWPAGALTISVWRCSFTAHCATAYRADATGAVFWAEKAAYGDGASSRAGVFTPRDVLQNAFFPVRTSV
jgi:hypothetical protein